MGIRYQGRERWTLGPIVNAELADPVSSLVLSTPTTLPAMVPISASCGGFRWLIQPVHGWSLRTHRRVLLGRDAEEPGSIGAEHGDAIVVGEAFRLEDVVD